MQNIFQGGRGKTKWIIPALMEHIIAYVFFFPWNLNASYVYSHIFKITEKSIWRKSY